MHRIRTRVSDKDRNGPRPAVDNTSKVSNNRVTSSNRFFVFFPSKLRLLCTMRSMS